MKGTLLRHKPKRGKAKFGYSFDAGKDETGKRVRIVKRGFAKESEAHEALRKAIEEHQRTPAPERNMPTFAEFLERWFSECAKRKCAPKTTERYYELGQVAMRHFGDTTLDKLDTMQLQVAVNSLADHGGRITEAHPKGRPFAPKTVRHIAFLVHSCLQQAVKWKIISENPMENVDKPKLLRRKPKVLDRHGLDALLERAAGTRLFPLIVLGALHLPRCGEAKCWRSSGPT